MAKQKRNIPAFKSEDEEAEWWYKNQEELDSDFVSAAKRGELTKLTREKLLERIEASKQTSAIHIRIADADLTLAREQAAKKGMPYQTYIKSLLHEALRRRI